MKNPYYRVWLAICFATLMSVQGYAQNKETASRLATYFSPGTTDVISPDDDGFIRRWLLLEPIDKPNRSNTVFTDSYIRKAFTTEYFPGQFTVLPKDGDKVKVTIMFRGRELSHPELGEVLLKKMAEQLKDMAVIERAPKLEGRNMIMIVAPKATK